MRRKTLAGKLGADGETTLVEVEGRRIELTRLDKIIYPGGRFTKAHVIDYYLRAALYILPATLAWTANIAVLEVHPFLHRVSDLDSPTSVVFDLDLGEGRDINDCIKVAGLLRRLLADLKLDSFATVSDSKGLQVYVPLDTPASYSETQPFGKAVADMISKQHPKLAVWEMPKSKRIGRVFIDGSQNASEMTSAPETSAASKHDQLRSAHGRPAIAGAPQ